VEATSNSGAAIERLLASRRLISKSQRYGCHLTSQILQTSLPAAQQAAAAKEELSLTLNSGASSFHSGHIKCVVPLQAPVASFSHQPQTHPALSATLKASQGTTRD
jgi:hypothetical protein